MPRSGSTCAMGPTSAAATPGACFATTNPPYPGMGVCLPRCGFDSNASAAVGCVGNDVCNAYDFLPGSSGGAHGDGHCLGGCRSDADCRGERCDSLTGLCVTTVTVPVKGLGDPCVSGDSLCNCPWTNGGYCTQFCVVTTSGGSSTCPSGWFCETQEPLTLTNPTGGAPLPGFSTPTGGLAGVCVPSCNLDGGTAGTDAGSCPPGSTCQDVYAGGPACLP